MPLVRGSIARRRCRHTILTSFVSERCFSVKYLDSPPSGDSRRGSVRYQVLYQSRNRPCLPPAARDVCAGRAPRQGGQRSKKMGARQRKNRRRWSGVGVRRRRWRQCSRRVRRLLATALLRTPIWWNLVAGCLACSAGPAVSAPMPFLISRSSFGPHKRKRKGESKGESKDVQRLGACGAWTWSQTNGVVSRPSAARVGSPHGQQLERTCHQFSEVAPWPAPLRRLVP